MTTCEIIEIVYKIIKYLKMTKIEQFLTDFENGKLSKNACQSMIYEHFILNEYFFDKNICEFKDYCKHYVCPKKCKLSIMNDVIYTIDKTTLLTLYITKKKPKQI